MSGEIRDSENEHAVMDFELEQVLLELGYQASTEVRDIETQISSTTDEQGLQELMSRWLDATERIIGGSNEKQGKFQIGVMLSRARIYLKLDMLVEASENIQDAILYAEHRGWDVLAERLEWLAGDR